MAPGPTRTKYTPPGMLRDLLYLAGILALALALLSPIDVYAGDLFFMHMVQHILLMMAAPPLLQLANPMSRILWAFPRGIRRRIGGTLNSAGVLRLALQGVTVPVIAWLIFVVTIWVWHTPALYNAALASEGMHVLEHLTMFAAAIVFWWPVIGPAPVRSKMPHPLRFLYLFLALFQNIILGAILTFAQGPVYAYYEGTPGHWGFNGAQDQQLGGVLMWIPGTMMYFTALALLFFAWLGAGGAANGAASGDRGGATKLPGENGEEKCLALVRRISVLAILTKDSNLKAGNHPLSAICLID